VDTVTQERLTKYQKFEAVRVWRHELVPHPKNPRQIAPEARRKLKKNIKAGGLLDTIIWNRATGYVVGGHQRLSILDELEKYEAETKSGDYQIDVLAVNLAEADELAMLAFLNNPASQGDFDTDLLAALNLDFGVDFADMGFSKMDVDYLFDGDARFSDLFIDDGEAKKTKGKLDEIKAHRKESTEKMKEGASADFYFVVVARDQAEKDEVLKRIGVPNYEQFVSADAVLGVIPNAAD
jgi:hypothetical protein